MQNVEFSFAGATIKTRVVWRFGGPYVERMVPESLWGLALILFIKFEATEWRQDFEFWIPVKPIAKAWVGIVRMFHMTRVLNKKDVVSTRTFS